MFIVNNTSEPTRLSVRPDADSIFDAELPAAPFGCSDSPIYSYRHRLPTGDVRVKVDSADGRHKATNLHISGQARFVTVMAQHGFPPYLKVTRTEPAFG